MKFLQTGDLHLGKMFFEQSLLKEQEHMLNQLLAELKKERDSGNPYDALILAGDIYDRAVPPPEAVSLFDLFLTQTRTECPKLHVFIISGNHDSARRLSFAARLLEKQLIHITADTEHITQAVLLEKESGGTKSEQVAVYCLPFLSPACLGKDLLRQQDMVAEAVRMISAHHKENYPEAAPVLCAHLFTQGGKSSDSERLFVGTAEQVDAGVFRTMAYTALGHLHRCQNPAPNVWYAGSPLAYSFSEADETGAGKCFLRVNLSAGEKTEPEVQVEKIPIVPLHPVIRLTGSFEEFYRDTAERYSKYRDSFLEISCTDNALVENPMAKLKPLYPNLLSFRQDKAIQANSTQSLAQRREILSRTETDKNQDERIFTSFIQETCGVLPDNFQEELELFLEIADKQEEN